MPKKIILINSLGGGGAEKQVSYLFESGQVDEVLTLTNENIFPQVKSRVIFKKRKNRLLEIISHFILGPFQLIKNVKSEDSVLSFLEVSNFINLVAKKFLVGHKAIISIRISPSFYNQYKLGFLYKILINYLYPFADKIIVNSFDNAKELIEDFGLEKEKIFVVPNAVDKVFLDSKKGEPVEISSDFLISVGRLSPQKNMVASLKVFALLKKRNIGLKLLLLGKGPDLNKLKDQCRELNLEYSAELTSSADVLLPGYVDNPYAYMAKARLLILPSLFEGLPNVILESITLGTPVIAADCPTGPREIICPEGIDIGGRLLSIPYSKTDYFIWAKAVQEILDDSQKEKLLGVEALARSEFYSKERIISLWEKILN